MPIDSFDEFSGGILGKIFLSIFSRGEDLS
jgi:hypothetical protein